MTEDASLGEAMRLVERTEKLIARTRTLIAESEADLRALEKMRSELADLIAAGSRGRCPR